MCVVGEKHQPRRIFLSSRRKCHGEVLEPRHFLSLMVREPHHDKLFFPFVGVCLSPIYWWTTYQPQSIRDQSSFPCDW